jgi:hypothetical protein
MLDPYAEQRRAVEGGGYEKQTKDAVSFLRQGKLKARRYE